MLRSKKNKSILSTLYERELNDKDAKYLSLRLASQLLRSNSNTSFFNNYWEKTCSQPITYDCGYLYFANYTCCRSVNGLSSNPAPVFEMEKSKAKMRIADVISYSIPIHRTFDNVCECKLHACTCVSQYLLTISEDNWLCQYLMSNGKLIRQFYVNRLGHKFRFKYCDWDVYGNRFILTSTLNPDLLKEPDKKRSEIVVNLAIFDTFPFEFLALLEIKRSVFGKKCTAANISDQHLILGLGSSEVHIYSFEDFLKGGDLKPYRLGHSYKYVGTYGSPPTGLTLNFTYSKAPPLLFNVQCYGQIIRFGGYPYHYITAAAKNSNLFTVTNIETNIPAVGGSLLSCALNDDVDALLFHPDHSNRLLFKTDRTIDCYKLTNANGISTINKLYSMGFFGPKPERCSMSSFGRKIKARSVAKFTGECNIFCTDYVSDLDMFAILGVYTTAPSVGFVKLYDSLTGEEVRTIQLKNEVCDSHFYQLYIDMGSIVIIERSNPFTFSAHVYNM